MPRTYLTYDALKAKGIRYSRANIRRLTAKGKFPRPVADMGRQAVWLEEEIDAYIEDKIAQREVA